MAMDLVILNACTPFLLFGGSHLSRANLDLPVDSFDYRPVIPLRTPAYRVRTGFHHFDVREIHRRTPFDQCQHLFAAAHEKTFSSLPIQLVHFKFEQIPAGNAPRRSGFGIQPTTRLHDACPVRDQHIPPLQSFGKEPVFLGGVVGMGVDGIDQEFAWQTAQPGDFPPLGENLSTSQRMNMAVLKYYIIFVAQQRTP